MEETKQLTPDELQSIKELQTEYNKIVFELGSVEIQLNDLNKSKLQLLSTMEKLNLAEKDIVDKLQEKYGTGVIDINTGIVSAAN